jgi:signal recognition particle GTPase
MFEELNIFSNINDVYVIQFDIFSARDCHIDVVLVDTAGRMQDNEPLMRALSKVRL